jgi:DNA-binding transcriptional LysR family regulator
LFRLGLRPTNEAQLFAGIAMRALAQAPQVRLASLDFRRSDLARSLATSDLDVAFDVPSERTASLRSHVLRSDRLVVIARRGHSSIDGDLDLATYLALGHVVASPRPSALGIEDEALAAIGAERRIVMRCQHVDAACRVVAGSDLILTTSAAQGEAVRREGELQVYPLPIDLPPRDLLLLWHEAAELDPGSIWLRTLIREVFDRTA